MLCEVTILTVHCPVSSYNFLNRIVDLFCIGLHLHAVNVFDTLWGALFTSKSKAKCTFFLISASRLASDGPVHQDQFRTKTRLCNFTQTSYLLRALSVEQLLIDALSCKIVSNNKLGIIFFMWMNIAPNDKFDDLRCLCAKPISSHLWSKIQNHKSCPRSKNDMNNFTCARLSQNGNLIIFNIWRQL